MLPEDKQKRIDQVKQVLAVTKVAALATVNPGGMPHNSPVFMTFDADFNAIWSSDPASQHSRNIERTGHVFLTIFDSRSQLSSGLYIESQAALIPLDDPDFKPAFKIYSQAKIASGAPEPTTQDFTKPEGQRLYIAVPQSLWINYTTKDDQQKVVRDQRFRVSIASLQSS